MQALWEMIFIEMIKNKSIFEAILLKVNKKSREKIRLNLIKVVKIK